jgi:hypothetical protein
MERHLLPLLLLLVVFGLVGRAQAAVCDPLRLAVRLSIFCAPDITPFARCCRVIFAFVDLGSGRVWPPDTSS